MVDNSTMQHVGKSFGGKKDIDQYEMCATYYMYIYMMMTHT